MSKLYDVIIVGSGPAGTHAAVPLVEAGFKVAMLDGGIKQEEQFPISENEDFEQVRKSRADQHNLFLGKNLSGSFPAESKKNHSSNMSLGRFSYISRNTDIFLPIKTSQMHFSQTLAKGGLTEIWGGASDVFDDEELEHIGLPKDEIKENYAKIIELIGISGNLKGYNSQPNAKIESQFLSILRKYSGKKEYFKKDNIVVKPAALALLTKDLGERKKTSYNDLDYWLNPGKSLYQAKFTLEDLERKKNFSYIPNNVVKYLKEEKNYVTVKSKDFSGKEKTYKARQVILAAGALNTTRILLSTFKIYNKKIPVLTKPHVITPCLNLGFIGKKGDAKRHSLCQAVIESDKYYSQLYNYKSLLLFKLLGFSPLTYPESLSLLSLFSSSIVLADTRFSSSLNLSTYCTLSRSGNTELLSISSESNNRKEKIMGQMKNVRKTLRKLGLFSIKDVYMPEGSTAHYAGGVPISNDPSLSLRSDINGRVNNSKRIYVSDSSTWKALPSKPPTLTIMANARRVGSFVASKLR